MKPQNDVYLLSIYKRHPLFSTKHAPPPVKINFYIMLFLLLLCIKLKEEHK